MKIKKSALIQIAILILFVGIIEPTSFIGTWIHSLCGALRTMAFLVSVLLYLKDRIYRELTETLLIFFVILLGISSVLYSKKLTADYDYSYFKKADAIITVSPRCIQSVVNVHPKLKGKVVCIENIHSEALIKKMAMSGTAHEFDNKENYVKIVSIGRITNVKRFDRAVEAAKILKDSGIKFIWLLLGCGDLENKIKELIKKLGLEREFVLVGVKTNPYPYINNADIFVQTSDNEGKSMVIDEAKILKKPIVVTNYKTVSDVIKDGEDGIVADFTPESVAEKLMMIINDKSLKDKIISNLECEIIGNENEIEKYISLWRK